jgi:hypothetical protein
MCPDWAQQDSNLQPRDYESKERAFEDYRGLRETPVFPGFLAFQGSPQKNEIVPPIEG